MAKVRVIFRWLAAQDLDKFGPMKGVTENTVLWHLQRLMDNPGFYSEIFMNMCRYDNSIVQLINS